MSIGSKEFIEYADRANIPKSYRIWCYGLWREAQKQAVSSYATKEDLEKYNNSHDNLPDKQTLSRAFSILNGFFNELYKTNEDLFEEEENE